MSSRVTVPASGWGGVALAVGLLLLPSIAAASMPGLGGFAWEAGFAKLAASLSGPVAGSILTLAFIAFGCALCWSDGGVMRWLMGIVAGAGVIVSAPTIASTFFGFTAGVLWT
jgi:type IV secretory pathway VirB2 component (pilin)